MMNEHKEIIERSIQGREIALHTFGSGGLSILILGGVHGNESEGFLFAERFIKGLGEGSIRIDPEIKLHICPHVNPDGCAVLRRTNQNNVDLNRNLPTKDWTGDFTDLRYYPGRSAGSEVETAATIRMIKRTDPAMILSLHSYQHPMVNFNGDCEDLAIAMSEKNGLPAKGDIGYPTPGSLGTYTGWERNLPTITLEILRGEEPESVWKNHLEGVISALHFYLDHTVPKRRVPKGD
jgi:protein MpaA